MMAFLKSVHYRAGFMRLWIAYAAIVFMMFAISAISGGTKPYDAFIMSQMLIWVPWAAMETTAWILQGFIDGDTEQ